MVRFKNRWLLVEFLSPNALSETAAPAPVASSSSSTSNNNNEPLNSKAIYSALKQSVIQNFGDTGWGTIGSSLTIKYFSPMTNLCIIRVAREGHQIAWGGMTLITAIDGVRYIPHLIHLSGTIKHAQIAAIEHNRTVIARYRARANTPAGYRDSYETFLQTSTEEIEKLHD